MIPEAQSSRRILTFILTFGWENSFNLKKSGKQRGTEGLERVKGIEPGRTVPPVPLETGDFQHRH